MPSPGFALSRRTFGALGLSAAAAGLALPAHTAPNDSRLVTPTTEGLRLDSAEFKRLYGPGTFVLSALGNVVLGTMSTGQNNIVSFRFRATISGYLSRLRICWAAGMGYSGGTGGRIRLTLRPDDATPQHLPVMTNAPLARTHFTPGLPVDIEDHKTILEEVKIESSTAPLVRGQLYHVVMENIDPAPQINFISCDNAVTPKGLLRPARWLNDLDWATLLGHRQEGSSAARSWINLTDAGSMGKCFSAILQITTRDGASQGVSTLESGNVDPDRTRTISRESAIRERFTPAVSRKVSGLSFATSATVAGSLGWRFLQGGSVLASGRIQQPAANYHPANITESVRVLVPTWYDTPFPRDLEMRAGLTYDLELRPEGTSSWRFGAQRNGTTGGFTWPAAFSESAAEHLLNGRWRPYYWKEENTKPGTNWPVVLHMAP